MFFPLVIFFIASNFEALLQIATTALARLLRNRGIGIYDKLSSRTESRPLWSLARQHGTPETVNTKKAPPR